MTDQWMILFTFKMASRRLGKPIQALSRFSHNNFFNVAYGRFFFFTIPSRSGRTAGFCNITWRGTKKARSHKTVWIRTKQFSTPFHDFAILQYTIIAGFVNLNISSRRDLCARYQKVRCEWSALADRASANIFAVLKRTLVQSHWDLLRPRVCSVRYIGVRLVYKGVCM